MEIIEKAHDLMNQMSLEDYWPGFRPVAYALYNNEEVYLHNHPSYEFKLQKLSWSPEFHADTRILFQDYPTAIASIERYPAIDALYPLLVHEMFHGYQFLYGEKRFPNELLGSLYPLLEENIELRNLEREHLYSAVMFPEKSRDAIESFICLREKRMELIGEFASYEFSLESVEGTAVYVELLASMKIRGITRNAAAEEYSSYLLDKLQSNVNIRRGAYGSGLFICLYLDQAGVEWKQPFTESQLTLYEFLKQNISWDQRTVGKTQISQETTEILDFIKNHRLNRFNEFQNQEGYRLIIEGSFQSMNFDPINMITYEKRTLHPSFLGLTFNNKKYFFQLPAVTHFKEKLTDIAKVELLLKNKPVKIAGGISIEGAGNIFGVLSENSQTFTINI